MRWYNGVMSVLTILCVAIVLFVLTGCAGVGQQQYEIDKIESKYRKSLLEKSKTQDRINYRNVKKEYYQDQTTLKCEYQEPGLFNEYREYDSREIDPNTIDEMEPEWVKGPIMKKRSKTDTLNYVDDRETQHSDIDSWWSVGENLDERDKDLVDLFNNITTLNKEMIQRPGPSEVRRLRKENKKAILRVYNKEVRRVTWKCQEVPREKPLYDGTLEMPKEWMDQWPSLRENKQVDQ